ncbi:translocation/assembly module TamB domain-containing protein [Phaeodactylibacter xiamenensis]|uniref:translocation/assembly module TamB domain-containing protein n=1 Tax=Phaeodactylibacter xiamenensis TaxID=1524460 RepID=UPI003BA88634
MNTPYPLLNKLLKWLSYALLALMLLVVLLWTALQFPAIQQKIADKATGYLEERIQTRFDIDRIYIDFFNQLVLEGVYLEDQQQDTLLYAGRIDAQLSIFAPFQSEIQLSQFTLQDAVAHLERRPDSTFNFTYLLDAFGSTTPDTTTSKPSPWKFDLKALDLDNVRFSWTDSLSKMAVYTRIGTLESALHQFDLNQQKVGINRFQLKQSFASVAMWGNTEEAVSSAPGDTADTAIAFPFPGWTIEVREMGLDAVDVAYDDFTQPAGPGGRFDPAHLHFQNLALDATELRWDSLALSGQMNNLAFKEWNGFELQSLNTSLLLSDSSAALTQLSFQTPKSSLAPSTLKLQYDQFGDLANFTESVHLSVSLGTGKIDQEDLYYWSGPLPFLAPRPLPPLELSGQVDGYVSDLNIGQFRLKWGQALNARLSGAIANATLPEELALQVVLQSIDLSPAQLNQYLKGQPLPAEGLAPLGQLRLTGFIKGNTRQLKVNRLALRSQSFTAMFGQLQASDITSPEKLQFTFTVDSLRTQPADLRGFLNDTIPAPLEAFGHSYYNGTIAGTLTDFKLDGTLRTEAGTANHDIQLRFTEDYANASYQGELKLEALAMGQVLNNPELGNLSLELRGEGRGLSPDSINANLDGNITQLEAFGYAYQGLSLDGRINAREFEGRLDINDPNLKFHFEGLANLTDSLPTFRFDASLDTLNLQKLNLYPTTLRVTASMSTELTGSQLHDLEGTASIKDLRLSDGQQSYTAEQLELTATGIAQGQRVVRFRSPFLRADMRGDFRLAALVPALAEFTDGYFPVKKWVSPAEPPDSTKVAPELPEQDFVFTLELDNPVPLTRFFVPDLEQLDTAWIRFEFSTPEKRLDLKGGIPSLSYAGIIIDSLALDGQSADALWQSLNIQAVRQDTQLLVGPTQLSTRLYRDSMDLNLLIKGGDQKTRLRLNALLEPDSNAYRVQVLPDFMLNSRPWEVSSGNSVVFSPEALQSADLRISRNQQGIALQTLSPEAGAAVPPLQVRFEQFRLKEISKLVGQDTTLLSGRLNAQAKLQPLDTLLQYVVDAQVSDLQLNGATLGQMELSLQPDTDPRQLKLSLLLKDPKERLNLKGTYNLEQGALQADLNADQLPIAPFEFFTQGAVKELKGAISARLALRGSTDKPLGTGTITADSLSAFVNYLQTRFTVPSHQIKLTENSIQLGNMALVDGNNQPAQLSGVIRHEHFGNIETDLRFTTSRFQVLNTNAGDNDLFYGKVFVSADAQVRGPIDDLNVNVETTTLPGTALTALPLSEEQAIVSEDYIIFQSPEAFAADTAARSEKVYETGSSGYNLTLQLNLTPDAQITAIIDPSTGDQLQARGRANLFVELNANGQMSTTGNIEVTSGSYQMNYEGLVKRSFSIVEGSSIYLPGDPLQARFDIRAAYQTETPVLGLIQQETELTPEQERAARRRQQVKVLLDLEGDLQQPELLFDIQLGEQVSANLESILNQKMAQLRGNQSELNKQVFGLLLFNAFLGSGGSNLATAGENIALSSVSTLLTNQLNRLAENYVEGVDLSIGVDSYTTDASAASGETVTEVNLGLSKQLFNDRLSVQVGGNLGMSDSEAAGQNTVLAGDFRLEYQLTEDGRYKVRVFRRPDYDIFSNGIRTGASLIYQRSFGDLRRDSTQKNNTDD